MSLSRYKHTTRALSSEQSIVVLDLMSQNMSYQSNYVVL